MFWIFFTWATLFLTLFEIIFWKNKQKFDLPLARCLSNIKMLQKHKFLIKVYRRDAWNLSYLSHPFFGEIHRKFQELFPLLPLFIISRALDHGQLYLTYSIKRFKLIRLETVDGSLMRLNFSASVDVSWAQHIHEIQLLNMKLRTSFLITFKTWSLINLQFYYIFVINGSELTSTKVLDVEFHLSSPILGCHPSSVTWKDNRISLDSGSKSCLEVLMLPDVTYLRFTVASTSCFKHMT